MRAILFFLLLGSVLLWPHEPVEASVCLYNIGASSQPVTGPADPNAPAVTRGCSPLQTSEVAPRETKVAECLQLCADYTAEGWTQCTLDESVISCPEGQGMVINYPKPTSTKLIIIPLQNPLGSDTDAAITKVLPGLLGRLIANALGLVGTLTLVVFIYGGFVWLTSAGNEEKVSKGTHAMAYAAIGICIIFSSYAILSIVFRAVGSG